MTEANRSSTPVQSVVNEWIDRHPDGIPWLAELWDLAARSRPGEAADRPPTIGSLLPAETPATHADRVGKVFDRTVAPPAAFLYWMLMNPQTLDVRDPVGFGAKSDDARRWRGQLFSGDAIRVAEAQAEGLKLLGQRLAQRGRNKWWAFEGFSRVDACLITDNGVLFIDGRGQEALTSSALWFPQRSQLWRNVEAAGELAGERDFGVILAVNNAEEGSAVLAAAVASLEPSCPHLGAEGRAELSRHLLGFVVWADVTSRFAHPMDPRGL